MTAHQKCEPKAMILAKTLVRSSRKTAFLFPFLLLLSACDLANLEGKIGTLNHGMVLWALEIEAENFSTDLLDTRYTTYVAAPGILPIDGPKLAQSNAPVEVKSIYTNPHEDHFTRDDGRTVILYASAVFDKDTYALAYFFERGRFRDSYFHESYRIHIAPKLGSEGTNGYRITPDVPLFKVGRGEAVYIGTFGIRLKKNEAGRILEIARSYRVIREDADRIIQEIKLDPKRLRVVNVFEGYETALQRYQKPVKWTDFE